MTDPQRKNIRPSFSAQSGIEILNITVDEVFLWPTLGNRKDFISDFQSAADLFKAARMTIDLPQIITNADGAFHLALIVNNDGIKISIRPATASAKHAVQKIEFNTIYPDRFEPHNEEALQSAADELLEVLHRQGVTFLTKDYAHVALQTILENWNREALMPRSATSKGPRRTLDPS